MINYVYYTDGACSVNTGKGGFAFARIEDDDVAEAFSCGEKNTTNNRMEIKAILGAIKDAISLPDVSQGSEILIKSDSEYCINSATKWIYNWTKNNFFEGTKREVKNIDLWKEYVSLTKELKTLGIILKFEWVKGHSSDKFNNTVDKLAVEAREAL